MTSFAGPNIFAGALVYSTPEGNTGWTALRMGEVGHATYHHWDAAKPNLLQLDVYAADMIDQDRALAAVNRFWSPSGVRAFLVHRPDPTAKFGCVTLRDDLAHRTGSKEGLGPGEHLHLLVDQTGTAQERFSSSGALDAALADLVAVLNMVGMTPVMSHTHRIVGGFSYDSIVGITTSHVAMRVRLVDGRMSLSLDAFSCKNIDPSSVFRWLDQMMPSPDARRAILYNRHPKGEFHEL